MISTGGWFMDKYLLLFMFSPIINAALYSMTRIQYKVGLSIILFVNIVYGFCLGWDFNFTDIELYPNKLGIWYSRVKWMLVCSLLLSIAIALVCYLSSTFPGRLFYYNNPLVLIGAICIFVLFAKSRPFYNKAVNFIAASVFPIYLVSDQGAFKEWFMGYVAEIYTKQSFIIFGIYSLFAVLGLFIFTICLDQLRKCLAPWIVSFITALVHKVIGKTFKFNSV